MRRSKKTICTGNNFRRYSKPFQGGNCGNYSVRSCGSGTGQRPASRPGQKLRIPLNGFNNNRKQAGISCLKLPVQVPAALIARFITARIRPVRPPLLLLFSSQLHTRHNPLLPACQSLVGSGDRSLTGKNRNLRGPRTIAG